MRQTAKPDGTKIAQAAKDLNVTSVTIRRYLTEFNIETMADENGIKVLPDQAMEELKEIRRLKEEGLTNPKVLEILEDNRAKPKPEKEKVARVSKAKPVATRAAKVSKVAEVEEEEEEEAPKAEKRRATRRVAKPEPEAEVEAAPEAVEAENENEGEGEGEPSSEDGEGSGDGRSKHSLTCQTCGKVFEHTNPRLRDCLDCYRAKRKERRRGGAERHKNVIQHPLAQQAASKNTLQQPQTEVAQSFQPPQQPQTFQPPQSFQPVAQPHRPPMQAAHVAPSAVAPNALQRTSTVRNYRKAIEETRQITGSLKRRLERPDLPEGERRWLEQIYAYQLILHQGWRHLADYKAATQQQGRSAED
jgi:DNA-binding transcriptional MerR regulator